MVHIDKALYWELRAKILEHEARMKESQAALSALFERAGMDPGKDYRLDDATCAATLVAPPEVAKDPTS